jgi:hypothetical protein
MGRPVVHFEVIGKDPKKLRTYDGELFEWKFDTSCPVADAISEPTNDGFVGGSNRDQRRNQDSRRRRRRRRRRHRLRWPRGVLRPRSRCGGGAAESRAAWWDASAGTHTVSLRLGGRPLCGPRGQCDRHCRNRVAFGTRRALGASKRNRADASGLSVQRRWPRNLTPGARRDSALQILLPPDPTRSWPIAGPATVRHPLQGRVNPSEGRAGSGAHPGRKADLLAAHCSWR